jgi:hypothetical protein
MSNKCGKQNGNCDHSDSKIKIGMMKAADFVELNNGKLMHEGK